MELDWLKGPPYAHGTRLAAGHQTLMGHNHEQLRKVTLGIEQIRTFTFKTHKFTKNLKNNGKATKDFETSKRHASVTLVTFHIWHS